MPRALLPCALLALLIPSACQALPKFDVNLCYLFRRTAVSLEAVSKDESAPPFVTAELRDRDGMKVLRRTKLTFAEGARTASVIWPGKGLTPGQYMVMLWDQDGMNIDKMVSWTLPETPAWVGSKVGAFDDNWVPKPWTPLRVGSSKALSVSCWGRQYTFGGAGLVSVQSQGAELLASPMTWNASVSGRQVKWSQESCKVRKQAKGAVEFTSVQVSDGLRLTCDGRVEFDGFVKLAFRLESTGSPVTVDSLTVDIPYASKHATLTTYFPKVPVWYGGVGISNINAGSVPAAGWSTVFLPCIWIGDEDGGLQWLCESDEGWKPADPAKTIEVLPPAGGATTLRLNLIGASTTLSKPRDYTFAFEASPVKPMRADRHDWHYTNTSTSKSIVDNPNGDLRKMGVKAASIFSWTEMWGRPVPSLQENANWLKWGVKTAHESGMKLLAFQSFLMSDACPEFAAFNGECRIVDEHAYSCPGYVNDTVYAVCQNSVWADFMLSGIADTIDRFDLDGVYADSITCIGNCSNRLHGCGYAGEDGKVHPTCEIFAVRDFMKRIYRVMELQGQKRGKGLMFIGHTSAYIMLPAVGFCTAYLDTEHLTPLPRPCHIPLDAFRAEFMGHNFGIPAQALSYEYLGKGPTVNEMLAISLLHDTEVPWNYDFMAPIWKVWDSFGMDDARFLPYWKNWGWQAPDGVKVSAYSKPGSGEMLVVAANMAEQEAKGGLGLGRPITRATDAFTGKAVAVEGGKIVDAFPVWQLRMYRVQVTGEVAATP